MVSETTIKLANKLLDELINEKKIEINILSCSDWGELDEWRRKKWVKAELELWGLEHIKKEFFGKLPPEEA